jgi:acetyl/propionyl-CoA carboxylase alpha subunit
VEHPVTEAIAGVDLVHAQLTVAAGGRLPWTQEQLSLRGHAIECRVYAEDPENEFLPQAGRLLLYREPQGPGLRVDAGVAEGDVVSVNYDPLLAKLVTYGETRAVAIARASAALRAYPILGIRTNIPFLIRLLDQTEFKAGRLHTGLVEQLLPVLTTSAHVPPAALAAAALASSTSSDRGPTRGDRAAPPDPWTDLRGWGR